MHGVHKRASDLGLTFADLGRRDSVLTLVILQTIIK